MDRLTRKYNRLKALLESYGSLLVAYSGGVDSTLLVKAASQVLGDRVLAITADSPTYTRGELAWARKQAARMGVRHRVIKTDELTDERFARNPADRCYWCKRSLLARLRGEATREGIRHVAVAGHTDDLKDYRPGEAAVCEAGAVSPLAGAGLTKHDVRELSRRLGIPGWRREAAACLASRVPYGERLDAEALRRIARAESLLRRLGFRQVRVRCQGMAARIEVDARQVRRFFRTAVRDEVLRGMKRLGFLFVAIDLEGYRMGSLNAALKKRPTRSSRRTGSSEATRD
jgi:uncharacterized protein